MVKAAQGVEILIAFHTAILIIAMILHHGPDYQQIMCI